MALSSALYALILAAVMELIPDDVAATAGVVVIGIVMLARSWPRVLRGVARWWLSAAIGVPALAVTILVARLRENTTFSEFTGQGTGLEGPSADLWLAPVAAGIGLGALLVFFIQVVHRPENAEFEPAGYGRGSGESRGVASVGRLEVTTTNITGVLVAGAFPVWVLLAREDHAPLMVCVAAALVLVTLVGALRFNSALRLVLMLVLGGVAAPGLYSLRYGSSDENLLWVLGIAGAVSALVAGLFRVLVERDAESELTKLHATASDRWAEVPLGIAPVALAAPVMYFSTAIIL